jgi:hypothetical protein
MRSAAKGWCGSWQVIQLISPLLSGRVLLGVVTGTSTTCSPAAMRSRWQSAHSPDKGLMRSLALGVAESWQSVQAWSAAPALMAKKTAQQAIHFRMRGIGFVCCGFKLAPSSVNETCRRFVLSLNIKIAQVVSLRYVCVFKIEKRGDRPVFCEKKVCPR